MQHWWISYEKGLVDMLETILNISVPVASAIGGTLLLIRPVADSDRFWGYLSLLVAVGYSIMIHV